MYTFKFNLTLMGSILALSMMPASALAWEHHQLPTSFNISSTPHYGGNKAPLVVSSDSLIISAPSAEGMHMWRTNNDGIDWQQSLIAIGLDHSYNISENLVVAWSDTSAPGMFRYSPSSDRWSATSGVWPLANSNIIDVSASASGDILVLATTPTSGKLVEGELYLITGNSNGWNQAQRISAPEALVGDAKIITSESGEHNIIWSSRSEDNSWNIQMRHSTDAQSWSQPMMIVDHIAAPARQEAAVQIAADALGTDEISLAFIGWNHSIYSQVWSQAFDVHSGATTQALQALPNLGNAAVQPSLVSLSPNTWAVAWQQTLGVDIEIFVAQHAADGMWSDAVNISMDPLHIDRDPHIAKAASQTLAVAYTRRIQADAIEIYTIAEGDITDPSLDLDGDGIANAQEQGFDMDHDGIDDALSARSATWATAQGRYALIVEGNGELRKVQAPDFAETGFDHPYDYQVQGSLFSFKIHQLASGETTQVHLHTPQALHPDTTWLKFNPNAQWADSERNNIYLDATRTGLIITLTDGGAGDEDGISNGVIVDPAVLATPRSESSPAITFEPAESISAAKSCVTPTGSNTATIFGLLLLLSLSIAAKKTTMQSATKA